MGEKRWLWTAVVTGAVMIGVLFARQDRTQAPVQPGEGWTPSNKTAPMVQPQPPAPQLPPGPQPQIQPQPPVSVYEGLLRNSKEQNKQLVLFFTAKNCGWCQKMKSEVLPNTSVQQALSQYLYYVVDLDLEPAFGKKFGITALPTLMIIDGDERVQKQQIGYMTADLLINWLGRPTQPLPNVPPPIQQRQPLLPQRRPGNG